MKSPFRISKLDYLAYAISLVLCFFLFKQSDLTLTNNASFAYLYGYFWDFYDYNRPIFTGNNYLPALYWMFAIWNAPLKLLGLAPEITTQTWMLSTAAQTIWSKLLIAIFFFGTIRLLGKISDQICRSQSSSSISQDRLKPSNLFATSPIAIFAVFIFSGYDIFGVFFTLLGLQAYFSKDFRGFAFWFSIAISFKYFAALIYLPLVLIIEKRFWYLLLYGLVGLIFSALQFWMYWHSDAFHYGIFGMIGEKTGGHGIGLRFIFANMFYGLLCIYLYFSAFNYKTNSYAWGRRSIFACMLAYVLFFSWTRWHPQWFILLAPFSCLLFLYIKNQRAVLLSEIFGYLGFAVYCINNWPGNVDNTMIYGGALGSILPHVSTLLASDIVGRKWMALSRTLIYASLYLPLLIVCMENYRLKSRPYGEKKNNAMSDVVIVSGYQEKILFRIRFLVASYFFIAISIVCIVL